MRIEHTAYEELKEKYEKLLEFVKWCDETASCHACEYQQMLAGKLLKEIGEK
jgi:hypothetical protein